MNKKLTSLFLHTLNIGVILGVPALGTVWAFSRGGLDFNVFFEAARLVTHGWGEQIYRVSPDRFLYAPGFALLFSPFALLPRDWALGLWSLLKAVVLLFSLRGLVGASRTQEFLAGIALAFLVCARPLLIDFQYGQVNTLLLGVALLAIQLLEKKDSARAAPLVAWATLAALAVSKVFLLPLLFLPWIRIRGRDPQREHFARMGAAAGAALFLLAPVVFYGFSASWHLYRDWYVALLAKGLPIESHNQSFVAFLLHYFGGGATPVLSAGRSLQLGRSVFTDFQIALFALAWSAVCFGFILGQLFYRSGGGSTQARRTWTAILLGLLILPSHLIWKPYFVFSLPLAAVLVMRREQRWVRVTLGALFVAINLSSFDFVGAKWGARLEAGSILLLAHLALLLATSRFAPGGSLARQSAL